jgi:hypothetical protein
MEQSVSEVLFQELFRLMKLIDYKELKMKKQRETLNIKLKKYCFPFINIYVIIVIIQFNNILNGYLQ